jgi:hypothetical protein
MNMTSIIYKKIVIFILIVALLIPASFAVLPPKQAEAGASGCLGAFFTQFALGNTASAVNTPLAVPVHNIAVALDTNVSAAQSSSQLLKDCIEIGLVKAMAKFILSAMTQEVVNWINSGFEGKPAFVTDPGQFFTDIGDQIAGEFILGSALDFLCSPFKIQIRIQLALDYSSGGSANKSRCTLSGAINNVRNAVSDFSKQNWNDWISITQNRTNNPYGSYLNARAKMDAQISGKKTLELAKLNWGGGFLSWSECKTKSGDTYNQYGGSGSYTLAGRSDTFGGPESSTDKCTTQTPGSFIGKQLDPSIATPYQELGLAEDLDAIFNALGNQFFKAVISGAGGLLGSSQAGSGGSGSKRPSVQDFLKNACSSAGQFDASSRLGRDTADSQAGCLGSKTDYTNGTDQLQNIDTSTPGSSVSPQQNVAMGNHAVTTSGFPAGNYPDKLIDGDKENFTNGLGAVDSNYDGAETKISTNPWIELDLDEARTIDRIVLFQRNDDLTPSLTSRLHFTIQIFDTPPGTPNRTYIWKSDELIQNFKDPYRLNVRPNVTGQYVRIQGIGSGHLMPPELEVYENNAPVITLKGTNSLLLIVGDTYVDPGATAMDERDGDITANMQVSPTTVDTSKVGTTDVIYTVVDSGGMPSQPVKRSVVVTQPNGAPVITLNGQQTMTINAGSGFSDPGAIAQDGKDGDISSKITVSGSVNTSAPGTYLLRYNVINSIKLSAQEVVRTVIVQ